MEYYSMAGIDIWFVVTEGFALSTMDDKKILESERWTVE